MPWNSLRVSAGRRHTRVWFMFADSLDELLIMSAVGRRFVVFAVAPAARRLASVPRAHRPADPPCLGRPGT